MLNDEGYARAFGRAYSLLMSLQKDEDFEVDEKQARRFGEIVEFFSKTANKLGGTVVPVRLVPHTQRGDLEAFFEVFSLNGQDKVEEFCRVIKHASAFGIEPTADGKVCISLTVPNVFRRK